ncbi:MAG TPA: hypothetical protein VHK69_00575 [Chitinophagaceae bacterium]|jgi:hypothetical protein|nr:hypothetical protein [Chitinophagaceae bacterium]
MNITLAIKIDGTERRRRNVQLMHIIGGFLLLIKASEYYRLLEYRDFIRVLPFLAIGAVSLAYGFFRRRIDPDGSRNASLRLAQAVSFALLGFLAMPGGRSIEFIGSFVWSGMALVLLYTERRAFRETELLLKEEGIWVPGYYRDYHLTWSTLSDAVVRTDFVTLFHKENKYLQFTIDQQLSEPEAVAINEFIRQQLEKAKAAQPAS